MAQYELNLGDYLRILHKRKLVMILTFLAVFVGNFIYVSRQKPVYEAFSTVKVLARQNVAGILTEWIVYSPADVMQSQAKIITGYPIMLKVAFQLGLVDKNSPISDIQRVVSGLQGSVSTEIVKQTNIIRINAASNNAKEVMNLANAVAQVYVDDNLLEKKMQATTTREFIEEQLNQLQDRLKESEKNLSKNESGGVKIKMFEPIQDKLVNMQFDLTNLLQKYTEEHPLVVQLRAQIKDLEDQLKGFTAGELEYSRLLREVDVNKQLYAMLKQKLEEARITEAQKVGDIAIVDPAFLPTSPTKPNKSTGILLGIVMGILLAVVLVFILESMDTSLGTIEDIENITRLQVLGAVPSVNPRFKKEESSDLKRIIFSIADIFFRKKKFTKEDESYIRLISHYDPKSLVAEAYRSIRTNIKLNRNNKRILITSALPREGKTTVLINLGLVIAQNGLKTLLVSSDLRRPAIAKSFGLSEDKGLNEVITKVLTLEDALFNITDVMLGELNLKDIMRSSGIENIWILPSGEIPAHPSELIGSEEIHRLINELSKSFDVILFDSPPVLPITDALLLAPQVDGVVLVYEAGWTARSALIRAKMQLEAANAKILGVVLNHIKPETTPPAGYSYYNYKYKYYEQEPKEKHKEPHKREKQVSA